MLSKIKAYIRKKKQHKWMIIGMSKRIEETINDAYIQMNEHKMEFYSIKGYIRHLPIVGIEKGYPKSIYVKVNKCLLRMWQYSKAMGFIGKDRTFIDFLGEDIELKYAENWDKASKRIQSLAKSLKDKNGVER